MRMRWLWLALSGVALIVASMLALGQWQSLRSESAQAQALAERLSAAQREVEDNLRADLELRARWLADDPASAAYIADALASGAIDVASISDLLGERREQLGLDTVGLIDPDGRWVAGTRPWLDSGGKPAGHRLFLAARKARAAASGLVREEARVYLGGIVPVAHAGSVVAYAYAGRQLDQALARRLAALVPVELALVDDRTPERLWASSGERAVSEWLALLAPGAQPAWQAPLFGDSEGAQWLAHTPVGSGALDWMPILTTAAVLALAWLLFCAASWSRVFCPIETALALLERAAAGDYHLRAPPWPAGTRGRFATAFDVLMQRIGAR